MMIRAQTTDKSGLIRHFTLNGAFWPEINENGYTTGLNTFVADSYSYRKGPERAFTEQKNSRITTSSPSTLPPQSQPEQQQQPPLSSSPFSQKLELQQ
jgi:hypothetical protein